MTCQILFFWFFCCCFFFTYNCSVSIWSSYSWCEGRVVYFSWGKQIECSNTKHIMLNSRLAKKNLFRYAYKSKTKNKERDWNWLLLVFLAHCLLHLRIQHTWPPDINQTRNTKPCYHFRKESKTLHCFTLYAAVYTYRIRREDSPWKVSSVISWIWLCCKELQRNTTLLANRANFKLWNSLVAATK